ncbi:hypothetical protein K8B83_14760 [Shewanella inventionis]|uniref:hypothetical protein n=1 Tax=Shewanella inventionis TaxID=1738770 RepID=UPI001CBF2EAA|nr:hypothetical protein [Shewanella inventionis]UAL42137.1 hypothetical protein K8B83_14760 [Shewanella inventionis]
MESFLRIMRVAAVNFPVAASFIQISNELDAIKIKQRLDALEDPISVLHTDLPALSQVIYFALVKNDSSTLNFRDEIYTKYSRAFAILDSKGLIMKFDQADSLYPVAIKVTDPCFILYLCARFEETKKMDLLLSIVDSCERGKWLQGAEIQKEIQLPIVFIQAVFDVYQANGFGICSKAIGACSYSASS